MSLVLNPIPYNLSEVEIDVANGAITTKGPISVSVAGAESGSIVGATYDAAAQTWHVLIATPE